MSKYQFNESDIYLPGTDIPKNRLGLDDPQLIHEVEENLLQEAYRVFIDELNPAIRFDEAYFKSLHFRTFAGLYDWAGEYRSVDMVKGSSLFCRADYVPNESRRIFRALEQDNFLKNPGAWQDQVFSERLADYQCELIALHPFYELNGRITRLFFDLIAIYNGYGPIDYSPVAESEGGQPNPYILASIECVQGADNRHLQQIILNGLRKEDAG